MGTVAKLAGFPLTHEEPVGWNFTQGTNPYIRTFVTEAATADKILEAGLGLKPVKLEIRPDVGDPLIVDGLLVLSTGSYRATYLKTVMVADARILWVRKHVARRYNVRRQSGERHQLVDGGTPVAFEQGGADDIVKYADYSVKPNGEKWTAKEVIEDVLLYVTGGKYLLDGINFSVLKDSPVQNFELDDPGGEALGRAMSLLSSLTCWIDKDGMTRLTATSSGEEYAEVKAAGQPLRGPTLVSNVDLKNVRPQRIDVFFTVEEEVRFDFTEGTAYDPKRDDTRYLENVLPSPDPLLTIAGRQVVQGTWVPIDTSLFDAWNADTNPSVLSVTMPPISFDVIQKLWPSGFHGYYACLSQQVGGDDPIWARRFAMLAKHYRQTFRISRRWVDRMLSFRPVRAAIIDPVYGTRAPASVYTNYSVVPTNRGLGRNAQEAGKAGKLGWNTTGYPTATTLATGKPASLVTVDMLNQDQGIFHVNYDLDAHGYALKVFPSTIQNVSGSDLATTAIGSLNTYMLKEVKLAPTHQLAIVLTCVPAIQLGTGVNPDGLLSCFKVEVTPDDVKKILPVSVASHIGECKGPVWQFRVGPGVATARIAWEDGKSGEFDRLHVQGVGDFAKIYENLDPEFIRTYAQAAAGSVYSTLTDRLEGLHVTGLSVERMPVGRVAIISQELEKKGALVTTMAMPIEQRPIEVFSLLPESTRRVLMRLVQQ